MYRRSSLSPRAGYGILGPQVYFYFGLPPVACAVCPKSFDSEASVFSAGVPFFHTGQTVQTVVRSASSFFLLTDLTGLHGATVERHVPHCRAFTPHQGASIFDVLFSRQYLATTYEYGAW